MLTSLGFVGLGYLAEYTSRIFIGQAWGARELGIFATGMSLAYLVAAISLFGLPNAYSKKGASVEEPARSEIFTATLMVSLGVWGMIVFAISLQAPAFFFEWKYFLLLSPLLGFYRLGVVHFSILHKRSWGIFYQEVLNRSARLVALGLLYWFAREHFAERLGAMLFWTLCLATFALMMHHRFIHHLRVIVPSRLVAGAVVLSALPLSIGVISQVAAGRLEFVLPEIFGGITSQELGVFAAYIIFGQLLLMPSQIVTFNSTPRISRLNDKHETVKIRQYVFQCMRKIGIMSVPMFVLFALFGNVLIGLFFGEEFVTGGRMAFITVLAGYLLYSIASPVVNYLIGTGAYASYAWSSAISVLVRTLFIIVFLTAGAGLEGLAAGSMLGFAVYATLLGVALYRRSASGV